MKKNQFSRYTRPTRRFLITGAVLAASGSAALALFGGLPALQIGSDSNSANNPFVQPEDPAQSGGGRDQSLRFGDVLFGQPGEVNDLLIGRLGTDVLVGGPGYDTLVGGTEHFNPENRDRAFGGAGGDVFLWSPGDGSDFFNGGDGIDALVFGLMGELDDNGDLFFGVSMDQEAGEIFIDPASGLPLVDVTNSPGFCRTVHAGQGIDAAQELDDLGLDHMVRFFIRGIADAFANGEQDTDNGMRVTLHLKDVEVLICTNRNGGQIRAFDLSVTPPQRISLGAAINLVPQLGPIVQ